MTENAGMQIFEVSSGLLVLVDKSLGHLFVQREPGVELKEQESATNPKIHSSSIMAPHQI